MPTNCAVSLCNSIAIGSCKELGIMFHSFPSSDSSVKLEQWKNACKRKDVINPATARICSLHFSEEQYERDLKAELLGIPPKKRLRTEAVPTQKLPNVSTSFTTDNKRSKRETRLLRRNDKQLIQEIMQNSCESTINKEFENMQEENVAPSENVTTVCNTTQTESDTDYEATIKRLQHDITDKDRLIKELNMIIESNKNVIAQYESRLSPAQMQIIVGGKCKQWSDSDLAKAIKLKCISKSAYNYVREELKYPLPCITSIKSNLSSYHCSPGFIDLSFQILRKTVCQTKFNNILSICFDEMKVDERYSYDPKNNTIYGPHKYLQVILVKNLQSSLSQPVFFDFDCPITTTLLNETIRRLNETGYIIKACVCDFGPSNRKLLKVLNVTAQNPFIEVASQPDDKIYFFHDIPHALKLLRNHFIDSGYKLQSGLYIKKDIIESILRIDGKDLRLCHKLTGKHIEVRGSNRQNVRLAAQLFSLSVSRCLRHYLHCEEEAIFFEIINNAFDVFNSRTPNARNNLFYSGFGLFEGVQKDALEKFENLISSIRVIGRVKQIPFQKGILMSISSLRYLYEDLKEKYNFTYILTSRLNQDSLESFFSSIRGLGKYYDHPVPADVLYRIKTLLISRNTDTIVQHKNDHHTTFVNNTTTMGRAENFFYEPDNDNPLSDDFAFQWIIEDFVHELSSMNYMLGEDDTDEIINEKDLCVLKYIGGYIAKKFRSKLPHLAKNNSNANIFPCTEPSDELYNNIILYEKEFRNFHGKKLKTRTPNIMDSLCNFIMENHQNQERTVIELFVRIRTFSRIKSLNIEIDDNKRKIVRKMNKYVK